VAREFARHLSTLRRQGAAVKRRKPG